MATVTRKIHFLKIEMLAYNKTKDVLEEIFDQQTRIDGCIKRIGTLPFSKTEPTRYLGADSNNLLFMHIDDTKDYISGRLGISRKTLLPEMEEGGQLSPLNIPSNAGLAEITHFVFFPKYNVLGVEFNFYGPRFSRLPDYLLTKGGGFFDVINLHPILKLDVEEKLKNIGEISVLEIEVHRNAAGIISELDESLGKAFEAAANLSDAETVEIILKKKRYSKFGFDFPLVKSKLVKFLSRNDSREVIQRFKGVSVNKNCPFDFLADKMIVSRKVALVNEVTKSVDTVSMHLAIREAFEEMRDQLVSER